MSLLCSAIKVFERSLLLTLNSSLSVTHSHHGSCSLWSTPPAGHRLQLQQTTLHNGRDFSDAFSMITHHDLVKVIRWPNLPNSFVRWLAAYLHSRLAACLYNGCGFLHRPLQGSIIINCLFVIVSHITQTVPLISSCADDLVASVVLTQYASDEAEARYKILFFSLTKSHSILITSNNLTPNMAYSLRGSHSTLSRITKSLIPYLTRT